MWCQPTTVTQQAMSQRFLSFPAQLFEGVFKNLLPSLRTAWHQRNQRPLPESIQFALTKFARIWIVDSSTLEALFRKLNSLEDLPAGQLAGKMGSSVLTAAHFLGKCQKSKARISKFIKFLNPKPHLFKSFNLVFIPSTIPLVVLSSKYPPISPNHLLIVSTLFL